MTKSGAPSLLSDIRYFRGESQPLEFAQIHELNAFGYRVAWWLNAERVSLGPFHNLYLAFEPGGKKTWLGDPGWGEFWWFRYLHMPAPSGFPDTRDALNEAQALTEAGLIHLAPDFDVAIREACALMSAPDGKDRFTVLEKQMSKEVHRICVSVSTFPDASNLYLQVEDRTSGSLVESRAMPLRFKDDAFHLAGRLSKQQDGWALFPKPSYSAELTSKRYDGVLRFPVAEMMPAEPGLMITAPLKRFSKA